jgi:hypothetical protein
MWPLENRNYISGFVKPNLGPGLINRHSTFLDVQPTYANFEQLSTRQSCGAVNCRAVLGIISHC